MARALVTGGAGFIGSHLVDRLIVGGYDVVVFDDFSTGRCENLAPAQKTGRLDVIVGSVLHEQNLKQAMRDCELVFHLATKSVRHSLGHPLENHDVNSRGTINTLEAARAIGVKRLIYCSSSEVYGNCGAARLEEDFTVCRPVTIYGATKLAGEYYARAYSQTYGLPVVVVRPFNAYGPRAHSRGPSGEVIPRFVARILNNLPPVIFGSGDQTRDFTYVTEIAHGIALAGDTPEAVGRTINLAFGHAVSIADVARMLLEACRRTELKPEFQPGRPGDVNALAADTILGQSILAFQPEIELAEGLGLYLQWLEAGGANPRTLLDESLVNWTVPT